MGCSTRIRQTEVEEIELCKSCQRCVLYLMPSDSPLNMIYQSIWKQQRILYDTLLGCQPRVAQPTSGAGQSIKAHGSEQQRRQKYHNSSTKTTLLPLTSSHQDSRDRIKAIRDSLHGRISATPEVDILTSTSLQHTFLHLNLTWSCIAT